MPGLRGVVYIVIAAFIVGVGAGWLTTVVPRLLASPEQSPSSSPSPSASDDPVILVDLYPPITRVTDTDDLYAGLTDLSVGAVGPGVFDVVPGIDQPEGDGPTHWIRVEIEEGLPFSPGALGVFVLTVLNDERGWAANGRMVFARTDGAAEIRIVFANPNTVESLCARPHEAASPDIAPPMVTLGPSPEADSSSSVTPSASSSVDPDQEISCAEQGIIVVNAYRWADGLKAFGEDRTAARAYLLQHFLGHLLGESDATCETVDERASVMVDHEFDIAPCLPNGWPYPMTS